MHKDVEDITAVSDKLIEIQVVFYPCYLYQKAINLYASKGPWITNWDENSSAFQSNVNQFIIWDCIFAF